VRRTALFATALLLLAARPARPAEPDAFAAAVRPLISQYCIKCHGPEDPEADADLSAFTDESSLAKNPQLWADVLTQLRGYTMPPPKKAQPTEPQRAARRRSAVAKRAVRRTAVISGRGAGRCGAILEPRASACGY
jgi:hypothetical protein